jgi:hypothetical protein
LDDGRKPIGLLMIGLPAGVCLRRSLSDCVNPRQRSALDMTKGNA